MLAQMDISETELTDSELATEIWQARSKTLDATSRMHPRWPSRFRAARAAAYELHALDKDHECDLPPTTRKLMARYAGMLFAVLLVLAVIGGVCFAVFAIRRDMQTLDPLPDGVDQQGINFTIEPTVTDTAAKPDRLCARIGPGGDDAVYGVDYKPAKVSTDSKTGAIKVTCAYRP